MEISMGSGRRLIFLSSFVWALAFCPAAGFASVQTFFGIDLAAGPGGPHPNADTARASFLANIASFAVGVEDFESVPVGQFPGGSKSVSFPSTSVTGTITDLVNGATANDASISNAPVAPHWFATSGNNYFFTEAFENSNYFSLSLSTAVYAIGFYGTSFSDYASVPGGPYAPLQLFLDAGPAIDVIEVDPATITDGSVHFFGVVSDTPFTSIRLYNPLQPDAAGENLTDGVAIDDITIVVAGGVPEPTSLLTFGGVVAYCLASASSRRSNRS